MAQELSRDVVGVGPAISSQTLAAATNEERGLRDSLDQLAALTVGRGQNALPDLLGHVAEFAIRAIPGADGSGLTLLEDGHAEIVVTSSELVRQVEDIQYGSGEGPCITAADEVRTVCSGALESDRAWPRFGPQVARLGINSVVSFPLVGPDGVVGAMNVYAHANDAFDDRAVRLGELFAVPAAISVQNAHALIQARRLAIALQAALTSRAVIDYALGVIMSRSGATADEAYEQLQRMAVTERRTEQAVAEGVMDDAVRRARRRRRSSA